MKLKKIYLFVILLSDSHTSERFGKQKNKQVYRLFLHKITAVPCREYGVCFNLFSVFELSVLRFDNGFSLLSLRWIFFLFDFFHHIDNHV